MIWLGFLLILLGGAIALALARRSRRLTQTPGDQKAARLLGQAQEFRNELAGAADADRRPGTAGPASAGPATAVSPPGWHPDPAGSDRLRWWDGARWTEQLAERPG